MTDLGGRLQHVPDSFTPSEGRKFAFPVGAAFGVIGGISFWRGHDTVPIVLWSLTGVLFLAGIVIPGKLGPVYRGWMRFALLISKVTTPIFMGITYFLVIAPVGLVMRLMGRNPVVHKPKDGSFWVARPEGVGRRSDLRRQF